MAIIARRSCCVLWHSLLWQVKAWVNLFNPSENEKKNETKETVSHFPPGSIRTAWNDGLIKIRSDGAVLLYSRAYTATARCGLRLATKCSRTS
jgi:hypothetical protein